MATSGGLRAGEALLQWLDPTFTLTLRMQKKLHLLIEREKRELRERAECAAQFVLSSYTKHTHNYLCMYTRPKN